MAAKSEYLENNSIKHNLGIAAFTMPAVIRIALFTAITDGELASPGVTEVSGGGYVRQAVAWTAAASVANGTVSNTAEIAFPVATAAWGTVVGFGIYDAAAAGNLLYYGTLTASKTIAVDDQLKFAVGALTISEA
jgi:hypothetical protein